MTRQFKPIDVSLESVILFDQGPFEVLVTYEKHKDYRTDIDTVYPCWNIELHSVEVVIKGTGIDILPQMTTKQIHAIETEVEDSL